MIFRKICCVFISLLLIGMLAGCGDSSAADSRTLNKPAGVADILQAGMGETGTNADDGMQQGEGTRRKGTASAASESASPESGALGFAGAESDAAEADETEDNNAVEEVDIDLTAMSGTMVYSEVYSMMYEPEEYIGKKIKMEGTFSAYHDEMTGNTYFTCIIQDATACCAQGMEFQLTDDYIYPDDYPEEGGWVSVMGVFDTYREGEYLYCTLRDARLTD